MKSYSDSQERKKNNVIPAASRLFFFLFVPVLVIIALFVYLNFQKFKAAYEDLIQTEALLKLKSTEELYSQFTDDVNTSFVLGEYIEMISKQAPELISGENSLQVIEPEINHLLESYTRLIGNKWLTKQHFSLPSNIVLLTNAGDVIFTSDQLEKSFTNEIVFKRISSMQKPNGIIGHNMPETNWGEPYVLFYHKNEAMDLISLLDVHEDDYNSPIMAFRNYLFLLSTLISLLLALTIFPVCYFIIHSLKKVEQSFSFLIDKNSPSVSPGKNFITHDFLKINNSFNHFFSILGEEIKGLSQTKSSENNSLEKYTNYVSDALSETKKNLANLREEERTRIDENKKQQWITSGLTIISDTIRRNPELSAMGEEIVANLANYLEINQCGLFVLEALKDSDTAQSENSLTLVATYAYERLRRRDKSVSFGDGLVGEAAKSAKSIRIDNIPDDYLRITSGLGDATPKHLFLHPLIHEDQVVGVLELAAFEPFTNNKVEFLNQISEIIASAIANVLINEHTKKLLQETKEQADQMASQEEEMRQTLEELQATQEEMQRKGKQLEELNNEFKLKESKYLETIKEKDMEIETLKKQLGKSKT